MPNGAGGRRRPTRHWSTRNGTDRFWWLPWVCLALFIGALIAAVTIKAFSSGNFSITLRGFVTDVSVCDTDDGEDCLTADVVVEITDGDESTTVTIPDSLLPDDVKEGDPLKVEISIDESRRVEANERMETRKAKRQKADK